MSNDPHSSLLRQQDAEVAAWLHREDKRQSTTGAASSKGGFSYRGNSEGGAVAGTACGTNKRCTGAEAATEATTALAAAST